MTRKNNTRQTPHIRVAVVGAGPGGLVTLKTLLEASPPEHSIEVKLFEAEADVGGTFQYRSYENAELVSSKQLTAFSDHRFSRTTPDHVTLPDYVQYLKSYADRFELWPYIHRNCRVSRIEKLNTEKAPAEQWAHRLRYSRELDGSTTEETYDCSHLAICTGLHVEPNVPAIPGIEHIKGPVFHSSSYKTRSQLVGKSVLILGCGETAMDLAYEAIKANAKSVTMCFRTGFLSFPKMLSRFQVFGKQFHGGLPIDGLITNLFETAYVHKAVAESRLRWFVSDTVIKRVLWFLTGTQAGMNQHVGSLPDDRLGRAYVFLNKSNKAMPYLNRPYRTENRFLRLIGNRYIDPEEDATSDRWVDTCTFPALIDDSGKVVFEENPARKDWVRMRDTEVRPDCVIYCTGYQQTFPFFDASYQTADHAYARNIVSPQDPSVAFIGFVRPGVGAIPPIAEMQAMWFASLILDRMPLPTSPPHYHLLAKPSARIHYGVDHSAYTSQLAVDFGGSPRLLQLLRTHGLRVTFAYCFGASFVTFYRLLGPYKSETAVEITLGELSDTIRRRGRLGNLFFGLIPMVFYGIVNGLAWILEKIRVLRVNSEDERITQGLAVHDLVAHENGQARTTNFQDYRDEASASHTGKEMS